MDIRSILLDHGFQSVVNASVTGDLTSINQKLTDLDQFINGAFLDGIVTQIEAKKIEAYINSLNDSNAKVQQEYDAIYNNPDLTDTTIKGNLLTAKLTYDTGYNKLISDIQNAISDGVATKDEADLIDNDYLALTDETATLTKALEDARNSILGKRSSDTLIAAQTYTDQAKQAVTDITNTLDQRLTNTEGYIDGAFKDGVITEAEANNIKSLLNNLSLQKANMDNKYTEIINNYFLTDPVAKMNLTNAKNDYDNKYQSLVDTINNAIADGVATTAESDSVTQGFVDFETTVATLSTYMEKAIDSLSQNRADNAENLAKQGAADYTDRQVGTVSAILDDMASDTLITQSERGTVKDDVTRIVGYVIGDTDAMPTLADLDAGLKGEVYAARQEALNAGIDGTAQEYTDIGDAYTALATYLNGLTPKPWDVTSTANITVDKITWRNTWLNYYLSISVVKAKIAQALKSNADSKVSSATYSNDMVVVNQKISDVSKQVTYSCYIQSSNGFFFKNGNLQTTLTAIVRQGPNDITSTIDNTRFVWTRISDDPTADQTWNQNHINIGPTITVTVNDVTGRATFNCDVLDTPI